MRSVWRTAIVAAGGAGVAILSVSAWAPLAAPPESPDQEPPDWNILVVTLDTTRADRLGCYGYPKANTPVLDELARRGFRYTRCYTPAPITLPAHASLHTGLYPFRHQLRTNRDGPLHAAIPTLAERLHDRGYRTGAVVGAVVLSHERGLARGFEHYDDDADTMHHTGTLHFASRTANEVTDGSIEWLQRVGDERWFLWTHYFDPHVPYEAPGTPSEATTHEAYDREIAYTDGELGRLLTYVREIEARTGRPTAIVVVADHGESLGDHGEPTHGLLTYNPTVAVPLIIVMPDQVDRGTTVDTPVSLVDIYPTIDAWTGAFDEVAGDGRVLVDRHGDLAAPGADRAIYFESVVPKRWYNWSELRGAVLGDWKFVDAPTPELYNLRDDPAERHNRFALEVEALESLRRACAEIVDIPGMLSLDGSPDGDLTPIQRRDLESLGYLGRTHGMEYPAHRALDPKDMIAVHTLYLQGRNHVAQGEPRSALRKYQAALAADRSNPQVLTQLVELLNVDGTRRDATETLANRLAEPVPLPAPYDVTLRVQLGIAMGKIENFTEAERLLGEAVRLDPDDRDANFYYAHALLLQGKPPEQAQPFLDRAREVSDVDAL